MAFCLKKGEPLGPGIHRVYRGEAIAALKETTKQKDADAAKQVHEIRKHLKKMRALLRVLRNTIGERRFQTENRRLRDTGRQLSASRDAEVRLRTFDALREQFCADHDDFPGIRSALAEDAASHTGDAPGALKELAETLELANQKAASLDAKSFGSDELRTALKSAYQKGRAAWREAREDPVHDKIHEFRKRAKDLWYDVRILQRACPPVLKLQAEHLKKLTTVLGESLDLTLLRSAVSDSTPDGKRLCNLIQDRQERLQCSALDLGRLFFAETPKEFAKRISGYCPENRCGQRG